MFVKHEINQANMPRNDDEHEELGHLSSDIEPATHTVRSKEINLEQIEYPEGGARAWLDAVGAAGALFCTSGYINAFG